MILKEGVGTSTLPITKLNAIVHAAKEIALLHEREHKVDSVCQDGNGDDQTKSNDSGDYSSLGADDFLPIFIYCIVQAEIERPCALCTLKLIFIFLTIVIFLFFNNTLLLYFDCM